MKVTIVSLLFALPALAVAQTNIDPIDQRQKAFSQIEDVAKQANKTLNGASTDWALLIEQSETLYKNSHTLSSLFPEGSDTGSKAKSDIWLKPEKFEQLLAQMDEGFEALYFASKNQDHKRAQQGLDSAEQTCRNCHRSYRSRW